MEMDRYTQYLLGLVKMLNNYITESGNSRNFRKNYRKYYTVVAVLKHKRSIIRKIKY